MAIKRVSAKEAVHLAGVGYVVIDVRTVGEYQKGHPKGALNVPFQRAGRFDLKDNPDFCLLYTSPSPRDQRGSRMPSSA